MVGMGCDGASNMLGSKSGLASRLQSDNPELVTVHCLCHRLELAMKDVTKVHCKKLYDRVMTVMIGLHYFYKKSHKNKKGLQRAWDTLKIQGTLPPKVTGTRWICHVSRGVDNILHNFPAYELHLSNASHENAKAEGLVKILLQKEIVLFMLVLQDLLDPLMRLSLKLQSDEVTLADAMVWYEVTVENLLKFKSRDYCELLTDGKFKGVTLKGREPQLRYKESLIDGLIESIETRFGFNDSEMNVVKATAICNLRRWPPNGNIKEIEEFGTEEVQTVLRHFPNALVGAGMDVDEKVVLQEWQVLKRVLYKRYIALRFFFLFVCFGCAIMTQSNLNGLFQGIFKIKIP
ncbi:zinc finger protein 862-like [Lingula anatina]|uniref:Zinc finger protein 862-like n=1 Tax=Lingula anatina TaxID=7574 RepID=A0A1S3I1W5_LINAN|nr:zinc finger protein 862-like [Lingula anatina]|eukprot:XP_013391821.1 zinc finger protein 862-like [Lingula anatina]